MVLFAALHLVGCKNEVRSLSSKKAARDVGSHISHPAENTENVLKKSSLQEDDCQDDDKNTKDKNKIKRLQTSIHKNLLKLFHKLKQAKPSSMMPDRKEFTNFASQHSSDSNSDNQVSTGVPLSKVRDGIGNASQSQDMNSGSVSALNDLNKVVDKVLPNVSTAFNNSSKKADDSEGGSGSDIDAGQNSKGSKDPYAAIAAGPDHPRLPPDLKISPGSEGEGPPVVPVGMSNEGKSGEDSNNAHAPTPEGKCETSVYNILKETEQLTAHSN